MSLEEEYTTEPFDITDTLQGAPTMAGGIALIKNDRHIDHLDQEDLETMKEICENAIDPFDN